MRIIPELEMQAWLTCLSELRVANLPMNMGGNGFFVMSSALEAEALFHKRYMAALDRRSMLLHFYGSELLL